MPFFGFSNRTRCGLFLSLSVKVLDPWLDALSLSVNYSGLTGGVGFWRDVVLSVACSCVLSPLPNYGAGFLRSAPRVIFYFIDVNQHLMSPIIGRELRAC